jgi:TonB family protein
MTSKNMNTIKKISIALLGILLFATNAPAQTNLYSTTNEIEFPNVPELSTDSVFRFVEKMPEFPGGHAALMNYIAENLKYPVEIQDTGWQGRIVVQFVVQKTGKISNVRPFHDAFPPLDKEAVRVVESMPDWISGEHNGEKVNVEYILPVNINVQPLNRGVISEILEGDIKPQFPGGDEALLQYLLEHFQYTNKSDKQGLPEGRIILQFHVLPSGKISDVKVISGLSPKLDEEAMRVVEAMPDWIAAERSGENIDVQYRLSINFQLVWLNEPVEDSASDFFPAKEQSGDFIFPVTLKSAEFLGGDIAMMEFLSANIRYPADALRIGMQGQIVTNFVIGIDGKIEDVQIVESIFVPSLNGIATAGQRNIRRMEAETQAHHSLEREAIRVIRRMPNWLPGEQSGKKVKVRFTLPIVFRL